MTLLPACEPLVFIDLETTGANFANDRIIEIGCVELDPSGVRRWSSLVNPGQAISSFITGLTGIDSLMVQDAPSFDELAPALLERLRGRLFVAHNVRFDYTFLKSEFRRLGIDFRATQLCTVKLSRKLFPEHHRHSLDALVKRYAIAVENRHRALADAQALHDLWAVWHSLLPEVTIREAVDALSGRPEIPPQLDPTLPDDLPESPGAYAFFDAEERQLLVRRSTNLRHQVLSHFLPAQRDSALYRNTARVVWREAAGELGARLGELALSTGRKKPENNSCCSWQLQESGNVDYRPQLVTTDDLDFATTDSLFGLYASRREATLALRKLAEAHRLCLGILGLTPLTPGAPCAGFKQKTCRGACIGKEAASQHSVRLMMALARYKLCPWPYPTPVAMVESDEFGTRQDYHVVNKWRFVGTARSESRLYELTEEATIGAFDPEIYRLVRKFLNTSKIRLVLLENLSF